jgi:ferredoxin
MSTTIYYFSGRGNALNAARMVANKLGDTKLVPVSKALEAGVDFSADRIGFVFPVICMGIPGILSKFIRKMDVEDKTKYIFAAVTTGGMPAGTLLQLQARLKKKGLKLSAGFYLLANGTQESLDAWHQKTNEIVATVIGKEQKEIGKVKFLDRYILTGIANKLATLIVPGDDKKFFIDENCDGCGICKRVCPVKNIEIKGGKPVWLHKCEQCGSCFNWCPKKALHGKNLAARTYHLNPNVELADFIAD